MPSNGGFQLGQALTGGLTLPKEQAYYAGQKASAEATYLSAQTQDALAKAKSEQLKAKKAEMEAAEDLKLGENLYAVGAADSPEQAAAYAGIIRANHADFGSAVTGRGSLQQQKFRQTLGDPSANIGDQLAAEQGVQGKVVSPFIQAPGEYLDMRDLDQGVQTSPNVTSQIAERTEKTLHPERFRAAPAVVDPEALAAAARLIASGRAPLPTGRSMVTGPGAQIVKQVDALNPEFDAKNYPTAQAGEKAFTSGPPSVKVRSLNAVTAHMALLEELSDALQNGDIQVVNAVKQRWAKETGSPAPPSFEAARNLVAQEIATAIVPTGGSAEERVAAQNQFLTQASPQAIHGVANAYRELLAGQFDALEQQYKAIPGYASRADFNTRFLTPNAAKALKRGAAASPPASTKPKTVQQNGHTYTLNEATGEYE